MSRHMSSRPIAALLAASAVLALLSGCKEPPGSSLFPLEEGRRWTYRLSSEWENDTRERETVVLSNLGRDSALTHQPWVIRERGLDALKPWEPEPCRWLGYNAIIRSFVHEDQVLANPNTAPWRRKLATGVAGFMEGFMH